MIKIEVKEGKLPWLIGSGTICTGGVIAVLSVVYAKDSADIKPSFYGGNFYANGSEHFSGAFFSYAITALVVMLIILAGVALCLCAKNRGIVVENESLCYKNCFGRERAFSLSEIGYCRAALENGGSRDYLILYDVSGNKLCKLEFNMKNADVFLQYLADNEVKIECSQKSDLYLKWIAGTKALTLNEAAAIVNRAYGETEELITEWIKNNKSLGAEWKFGLAFYTEDTFVQEGRLWEQEGCPAELVKDLWEDRADGLPKGFEKDKPDGLAKDLDEDRADSLPRGFFVAIEGYLQKDGKFVIDRKNQAVSISTSLIQVSESYKIGETLKICFFKDALEYLEEQLLYYAQVLPKRRYHTEMLELRHELRKGI